MTDELATSADIQVGADAFLERDAQVLDVIGIGFVRGHADPFAPSEGAGSGIWSEDPVRFRVSLHYGGFTGHEVPLDSALPAIERRITPSLPARHVHRAMSAYERDNMNRTVYGWLCRHELGPVEIQEAAIALINFERDGGLSSPAYNVRRREIEVEAARVLWVHRATAMPMCVHPMQVQLRERLLDLLGKPVPAIVGHRFDEPTIDDAAR